jgi:integrase
MFEADEIKEMLAIAPPQLKAMVFLGINCGFGNADCANLYPSSIQGEWARLPRSKTAIQRHCPLWPETLEALDGFKWGEMHVFITQKGNSWGPKSKVDDPIGNEMRKLMKNADAYRKGRGFYALRHTFNTIGLRTKDTMAVKYIMGHIPSINDMTANYNQEAPPDEDLLAVTEYVREWLFG